MVSHGQPSSKELQRITAVQNVTGHGDDVTTEINADEAIKGRKVLEFKVFHGFLIAFFFWVL